MHTGLELSGKRFINHAMAGESALPPKRISHDIDPEMRLSPRSMSGMPFVLVGFIKHLQAQRSEGFSELPGNGFLRTHQDSGSEDVSSGLTIPQTAILPPNMSHHICQACAMR